MANLHRVKLQGIRSINDDKPQYMTFLSPLTVISGPNGTGKTTIIEALNYITTGKLPPGQMASFANNPDTAIRRKTDGLVQLEFTDCRNNMCVATKRFTATKKGAKFMSKSDEFTLKVSTPTGDSTSISSKVADFNLTMINHLGLPPAILDLVIFCHQEESCWPLSESRELKKKFDSIFQLTKYVKALELVKKTRKVYDSELKVLKETKIGLEFKLSQSNRLSNEMKKLGEKEIVESAKIEEYKSTVKTKRRLLKELSAQLESKVSLENAISTKESQKKGLLAQLTILRVQPYHGSPEELEREIEEMRESADFRSIGNQKIAVEKNIREVDDQLRDLNDKKSRLQEEVSEMKVVETNRIEIEKELALAKEYLEGNSPFGAEGDLVEEYETEYRRKEEDMESTLKKAKENVREYDKKVENIQKELTTIDVNIKNATDKENHLKSEVRHLEMKQRMSSGSSVRLTKLTAERDELEKKISVLPEFDENSLANLIQKRSEAQRELDSLTDRSANAEKYADAEKDMERKYGELKKTKNQLEELLAKHSASWNIIHGSDSPPPVPRSTQVKEVHAEISASLKSVERSCRETQMKEQHLTTLIGQKKREIEKLTSDVEILKDGIWNRTGCDPGDVTVRLTETQDLLKMARKELAPIDAKENLYQSWIEQTKKKSCCPLCDRKFQTKSAEKTFNEKLLNASMQVPDEKEQLEKTVLEKEELVKSLMTATMEAEQLEKLNQQLEQAQSSLLELEKEVKNVKTRLVGESAEQKELSDNFSIVQALQSEVSYMDQLEVKRSSLESELERVQSSMKNKKEDLPASTLRKMCTEKQESITKLVADCEHLQMSANQRNVLCDKVNAVREEIVTLGENAAKMTSIVEQISEKKALLDKVRAEIDEYRRERPVISERLQELITSRKQVADWNRKEELKLLKDVQDIEHRVNRVKLLISRMKQMPDVQKELTTLTSQLSAMEREVATRQKRRVSLEMELANLGNSQTKLRTLEDQYTRILIEKQVSTVDEEIKEVTSRMNAGQSVSRKEYTATLEQVNTAETEIARCSGVLNEVKEKLNEVRSNYEELRREKSYDRYRAVMTKIITTEASSEDCVKYARCLDESLLQFHKEKLEAINDMIDDLWKRVYRGDDVESIRIKSNEGKSAGSSYEYQLVMTVMGVEQEMRGKCSAGQKMLASLIIRIALAEVFGGTCQMITLDEPTTNLDTETVMQFTDMLTDLINFKSSQLSSRKFQLVLITHDVKFVDVLTQRCLPEYIYELHKDTGSTIICRRYPNGQRENPERY